MEAFEVKERVPAREGRRARQSDDPAEALEGLYRTDAGRYRALAASIVGAQRADDVVQEAFARALRKQTTWRGDGPLSAWLWRLVLRTAYDADRGRARFERMAGRLRALRDRDGEETAVDDRVREPIRRLPRRQRDCIVLRYYGDLAYEEIAAVLEISPGTVGALLSKAHVALRTELEQEGI